MTRAVSLVLQAALLVTSMAGCQMSLKGNSGDDGDARSEDGEESEGSEPVQDAQDADPPGDESSPPDLAGDPDDGGPQPDAEIAESRDDGSYEDPPLEPEDEADGEEFECAGDGDCLDGNVCNGRETCDPGSHMCVGGTPEVDGTVCGTDPRRVCVGAACLVSTCGDGFLDAGGGEECEAGDSATCRTSCGSEVARPCGSTCLWDACPPPAEEIRINCGGAAYTDTAGKAWMADTWFTGGFTWSTESDITGTVDDPLFQTERTGNPPFSYRIPVSGRGAYTVNLYFDEIVLSGAGERVFDVTAEGVLKIDDLDIFAMVGGMAAYSTSFTVDVTDGALDLAFVNSVSWAKVNAIEVCW